MREFKNKNVQILSIEAKDLLTKNYCVDDKSLRKGSLDYSMETDELRNLSKTFLQAENEKRRNASDRKNNASNFTSLPILLRHLPAQFSIFSNFFKFFQIKRFRSPVRTNKTGRAIQYTEFTNLRNSTLFVKTASSHTIIYNIQQLLRII